MAVNGDGDAASAPSYSKQHVDNCAFASWYPTFKHVAIKGEVIALPDAFVALLLADGVKLPPKIQQLDDDTTSPQDEIVRVQDEIERVIDKMGGKVFAKLNWSCPRDASWMLGSLQCASFEDVFLLLKSSDFVLHDLVEPYSGACADPDDPQPQVMRLRPARHDLVLKKWCNLYDSMLFRCFVVDRALVGVCQRHCDDA